MTVHRILMTGGWSVSGDWAQAASTVADVVVIQRHADASRAPFELVGEPPLRTLHYYANPTRPRDVIARARRRVGLPQADAAWLRAARHLMVSEGFTPDVIHLHFGSSAYTLGSAARRLGVPYLVTEHSPIWMGGHSKNRLSRSGLRLARREFPRAAMVLAVSPTLADAIRSHGVRGRLAVLPNPVDIELYHPLDDPPPMRRTRAVCVARLEPVKNHRTLLEAWAEVRRSIPDAHLTLVGGGSLEVELQRLAKELGIESCVTFLGKLNRAEIGRVLRQKDLFVIASAIETFNIPIVEALCTGLPVVATAAGGPSDLVTPSVGGLVEPGNSAALADAIVTWLQRSWTSADRSRCAAHAAVTYSLEAVGRKLLSIYDEVAEGRSSATGAEMTVPVSRT